MPNLNKIQLMGNLTRDPELKHTPKGTAVTDIGLAVNRIGKDDDGQRTEETTFVDVTFWGRTAETVAEYMSKGRPLYVEGRLKMDTWQDKETGQNRSKLKVIGDTFQFLGGREEAPSSYQPPAAPSQQQQTQPSHPQTTAQNEGADIPF